MRKKPLALRIFIRICVVFMVVSLVWAYVMYMFSPNTEQTVENTTESDTENSEQWEEFELIIPEIDPENPENSASPILITDDEDVELETQVID